MKKLTLREKKIMDLRFGLSDGFEKTQRKWPICWEYRNHIYQGWKKNYFKIEKEMMKMS